MITSGRCQIPSGYRVCRSWQLRTAVALIALYLSAATASADVQQDPNGVGRKAGTPAPATASEEQAQDGDGKQQARDLWAALDGGWLSSEGQMGPLRAVICRILPVEADADFGGVMLLVTAMNGMDLQSQPVLSCMKATFRPTRIECISVEDKPTENNPLLHMDILKPSDITKHTDEITVRFRFEGTERVLWMPSGTVVKLTRQLMPAETEKREEVQPEVRNPSFP